MNMFNQDKLMSQFEKFDSFLRSTYNDYEPIFKILGNNNGQNAAVVFLQNGELIIGNYMDILLTKVRVHKKITFDEIEEIVLFKNSFIITFNSDLQISVLQGKVQSYITSSSFSALYNSSEYESVKEYLVNHPKAAHLLDIFDRDITLTDINEYKKTSKHKQKEKEILSVAEVENKLRSNQEVVFNRYVTVRIDDSSITISRPKNFEFRNNNADGDNKLFFKNIVGYREEAYFCFRIQVAGVANEKSGGVMNLRLIYDPYTVVAAEKKKHYLVALKNVLDEKMNRQSQPVVTERIVNTSDKYDKLIKLKALLDNGILTQDEYDTEKAKLLSE